MSHESGKGFTGHKHTLEARVKIGAASKNRVVSLETRTKLSEANKGQKRSPEICAKFSVINRGRRHSAVTRAKIGTASKGRIPSLKTRIKMGRALRGRKLSPEHRAKISKALKGNPRVSIAKIGNTNALGHRHTAETRNRISATLKLSKARAAFLERRGQEGFKHTRLHLDLANFLLDAGFDLVSEVRFGRYCVDLYDPMLHLAFEADGDYWHGLPGRQDYDKQRDSYLLKCFDLPVVRFTEMMIKELTI